MFLNNLGFIASNKFNMPKQYTSPIIYDDLKTISISFLKQDGFLQPNQSKSGMIRWSSNGEPTGSITITVHAQMNLSYIQLDYTCNKEPISYQVKLISKPSNIGKGIIWYFVCPSTQKHCRKLYLGSTYFLHRSAVQGFYEKQMKSKKSRSLSNLWSKCFQMDDLFEQIHKKHFKKYYAGKPTKKYLRLMKKIKQAESISIDEILKLQL